MIFTNVSGKMAKYNATIETGGDEFPNAAIRFSGEVDSIITGNADHDAHLPSLVMTIY
jgi:polyisoprenoid-binding protein YceI